MVYLEREEETYLDLREVSLDIFFFHVIVCSTMFYLLLCTCFLRIDVRCYQHRDKYINLLRRSLIRVYCILNVYSSKLFDYLKFVECIVNSDKWMSSLSSFISGHLVDLFFKRKFYIHSIKSMLIRDDLALWYIWVLHVFVLSKMHFECWRKSIVLISWSQALWCYLLSQHNSLNFEGWHFRWAWSTISLPRCSFYANPNFAQPLPAPRKYQKVLFKG